MSPESIDAVVSRLAGGARPVDEFPVLALDYCLGAGLIWQRNGVCGLAAPGERRYRLLSLLDGTGLGYELGGRSPSRKSDSASRVARARADMVAGW